MRSSMARRSGVILPISRKPVGLPMLYHHDRLLLSLRENTPIIKRHDLHQLLPIRIPALENSAGTRAARELRVSLNKISDKFFFFGVFERFEIYHLQVAALSKISVFVDHIGHATAHTGCEVST